MPPKPKMVRTPTGRFAICPASQVVHPRTGQPYHPTLFAPIFQGRSGCFFAECLVCRKKYFLHDAWEFNAGWLPQDAPRFGALLPTFEQFVAPPPR